ncbi:HAD-IB family phosphatase [Candidatus Saccharibacteria bacterium]|jgi:HAD superfamily phosphoserine phosphatase-like hydrolase|nr:HAD-IB family phosphatase [Candidatus Saccharibacteria bacterium]
MERRKSSLTTPESLVVFDVDGTLMQDNPDEISGRAFWELNKRGIFNSSDETLDKLQDLRNQYASCPNFERQEYLTPMIIEFDKQMRNQPVKLIEKFAAEQAEKDIDELLYPEMAEEIELHRELGSKLGIISGSPDVFIQAIKRVLNFDLATGTRHFHNRKEYHTVRGVRSRGKEKHGIAEKWRSNLGKEAILSAAYGDTTNDLSLLIAANEPVAVNPKPDLEEFSRQNDWEIIYTKERIKV